MKVLSNLVTSHYKIILIAWLLIFAVLAVFAIRLPSLLEGDGFSTDGEHAAVMEELSDTFDLPAETLFLVFNQTSDETIKQTLAKIERIKYSRIYTIPFRRRNTL